MSSDVISQNRNVNDLWTSVPIALFALMLTAAFILSAFVPDDLRMMLLALPFAALAGMTILVRPKIAMYMSIAYIPFESSQFDPIELPGGLSISKVLGALLLGAFFFNILFRRRPFRVLDDNEDFTILLLAFIMLFSGIMSEYPRDSLSSTFRMVRIFAFYFAVKNLITTPRNLRVIMWLMSLGITYASWWGLNAFFENRKVRIHDIRVGGIEMNPNEFAILAIMALMAMLHLMPITRNIFARIFLIFGSMSTLAAIILSGSRGGLIALVVVGGIYVYTHPMRKQIVILLIVAAFLSWPVWPDSVKSRFGASSDETSDVFSETADYSTRRRLSYVEFSLKLMEQHPFTGIGYGTFPEYYPRSEFARLDNPMTSRGLSRVAHNTYLEIVVGTGFVGLFIYLAHLVVVARDLLKISLHAERGTVAWSAARAFLLALIAFMLASVFLSIEHFNYLWMTSAIASALRYMVVTNPELLTLQEN